MIIKRAVQILALLIIDILAFYSAMILAIWVRGYVLPKFLTLPPSNGAIPAHIYIWWLPVVFISAIAYEGLYTKREPFWEEARLLIRGLGLAFLISLAIVSLGKLSGVVSRLLLIHLWFFAMVFFTLYRWIGKRILVLMGIYTENVLIIGAGKAGLITAKGLEREKTLGYRVVGFLDDDKDKIGKVITTEKTEYKIYGPIEQFKKFVGLMKISTIIIAIPSLPPDAHTKLVNRVQQYVLRVLLVPDLKGISLMNTELSILFMEQLFLLKIRNNLKSLYSRVIKRVFDIVVSTVLLILLSPVFLIIYLLIRLSSPGGGVFVQRRIGRDGNPINIYKFRTMYLDSEKRLDKLLAHNPALKDEWEKYRKLKDDPRITPIGRFLRKYSLDELPQIFNVLKGDMSMVGPRPCSDEEVSLFGDAKDIILRPRPGLCSLWHICGRNKLTLDERIKLEEWYVLNWSLWLDIVIMIRTAKVILTGEGAY